MVTKRRFTMSENEIIEALPENEETIDISAVKTGVFTINHVSGVFDDLSYNSINIDFEERQEEIEKKYRNELLEKHNLPEDYDFVLDELEVVDYTEIDEYTNEADSCDTELVGFIKADGGKYIENPEADYSCIFGESEGFVTQSKYICQCNHGSPCIPYQCDLESDGNEWAFTLPPEVWSENKPEFMKIYKLDHKVGNLTGKLIDLTNKGVYLPPW